MEKTLVNSVAEGVIAVKDRYKYHFLFHGTQEPVDRTSG